jgi:mitotic spindle assembly checkpoint protein MAD2
LRSHVQFSQSQANKNAITIKGSAQIVAEFFGYSINRCAPLLSLPRPHRSHAISSILYQRGIYPPETFTRVEKYGLGMLVTKEDGLKNYLNNVLKQLKGTVLGSVQE